MPFPACCTPLWVSPQDKPVDDRLHFTFCSGPPRPFGFASRFDTFTYRLLKAVSITGPRTTFDCCCVLCLRTHEKGVLSILGAVAAAGVDQCLGQDLGILLRFCLCGQVVGIGFVDVHILVDEMEQVVTI